MYRIAWDIAFEHRGADDLMQRIHSKFGKYPRNIFSGRPSRNVVASYILRICRDILVSDGDAARFDDWVTRVWTMLEVLLPDREYETIFKTLTREDIVWGFQSLSLSFRFADVLTARHLQVELAELDGDVLPSMPRTASYFAHVLNELCRGIAGASFGRLPDAVAYFCGGFSGLAQMYEVFLFYQSGGEDPRTAFVEDFEMGCEAMPYLFAIRELFVQMGSGIKHDISHGFRCEGPTGDVTNEQMLEHLREKAMAIGVDAQKAVNAAMLVWVERHDDKDVPVIDEEILDITITSEAAKGEDI
jgi:hypothetical protein